MRTDPAQPIDEDGQAGFTTLEALLAIALLGIALIPLLSFQSQVARGSVRLEDSAAQMIARQVSHQYLSTLDYKAQPEGHLNLGDGWGLTWTAHPEGPLEPVRYGAGLPSRYAYKPVVVEAELAGEGGRQIALHSVQLIIVELVPAAPL